MSGFLCVLLPVAMFATLDMGFFRLIAMARGGEFDKRNANRFSGSRMRARSAQLTAYAPIGPTL